jgi:hypothetical protein
MMFLYLHSNGSVRGLVLNSGNVVSQMIMPSVTWSPGQWHYFAASVDEANSLWTIQLNKNIYTGSGSYASPSSGAAQLCRIGALSEPAQQLPNGARVSSVVAWDGVIWNTGALNALFQANRGKFGA